MLKYKPFRSSAPWVTVKQYYTWWFKTSYAPNPLFECVAYKARLLWRGDQLILMAKSFTMWQGDPSGQMKIGLSFKGLSLGGQYDVFALWRFKKIQNWWYLVLLLKNTGIMVKVPKILSALGGGIVHSNRTRIVILVKI